MTDFRAFEIVEAIARDGSISRAAEALQMSQPALTKALATLEADVGSKLFARHALGMEPTEYAHVFLRRWEGIHRDLIEMRLEIERVSGMQDGCLRIATGYLAASSVEIALGIITQKFPSLRILSQQLVWSEVAAAVRRGDVDIGVADPTDAEEDPSLDVEELVERKAFFVCRNNHPILSHKDPSLCDILSYPLALSRIPESMASRFSDCADDIEHLGFKRVPGGHLRPQIEVQSVSAMKNILLHSNAITIMPDNLLGTVFLAGQLAKIEPFQPDWLKVRVAFITRKQSLRPPVIQAFIDEVRAIETGLRRYASGPLVAGSPEIR